MKLAFITATPQNVKLGSGTFVGTAYLIDYLRSQGNAVDVYAPKNPIGFMGYTATRFRWNWALNPAVFKDYDAVVGIDMDGYTIAHRIKVPFLAYINGIIADEAKFERGWVRTALELMARAERVSVHRAERVIATSQYSCDRLSQLYQYDRPIEIVPPPMNVQGWDAALVTAAHMVDISGNQRPTVLCVGVQYPRKNVATLIRAAAILRKQVPDVEIRIASKGPEWNNLRRLAQELDLNETVTFLGYVPHQDLVQEYRRCDVFCLPSLQEGFGIVFAEAMATSKPIVASRSSSTPEVIQDGVQGLLATPLDPADLADKLAHLLRSPETAEAMGKAGRAKVMEFDVPAITQRFSQLLAQVCDP